MHADQGVQNNNSMHWMWVNEVDPFMTNGELREVTESSSAIESDSETVVIFNIDRLNDEHPMWLCGTAWEQGQILESNDGLIDSLVNREDRDRLRAKAGSVRNGPSISHANGSAQYQSPIQNMHGLQVEANPAQSVSLIRGWKLLGIQLSLTQIQATLLLHQLSLILASWAASSVIKGWESSVVLQGKELALNLIGLGGTLDRS